MDKEIIKQIIIENEKFISSHIKNIIHRENIRLFSSNLKKVCVFYGVRRCGKSFLLFHLFLQKPESSLYIDFEDERFKEITASELNQIKEAFFELKPQLLNKRDVIFLFDEIQNVKLWEKFVRRLVEKENIQVFCAGSSSKITPQYIHTSLRGRVWSIEVMPFSFKEFLIAKNFDISSDDIFYSDSKIWIKTHFQEFLKYGGFPEVVLANTEFEKRKILHDYMEALFFRDLVEKFEIKNIYLLEALWDKLFSAFSTRLSLSAFFNQYKGKIPFSKDTLFSYYKYFLESLLVYEIRKFTESTYKRMRNPPKIYLIDVGLAKRITSEDKGRLLENIIFLELKRRGYEIFYFQEKHECDFVVKKNNNFELYQITYNLNEKNKTRELMGIIEAAKSLGLKQGTIITYDQEDQFLYDDIEINVIPAWKWLILE